MFVTCFFNNGEKAGMALCQDCFIQSEQIL